MRGFLEELAKVAIAQYEEEEVRKKMKLGKEECAFSKGFHHHVFYLISL